MLTTVVRWFGEFDHGLAVMRGDPDGRNAQSWHQAAATAPAQRRSTTHPS